MNDAVSVLPDLCVGVPECQPSQDAPQVAATVHTSSAKPSPRPAHLCQTA